MHDVHRPVTSICEDGSVGLVPDDASPSPDRPFAVVDIGSNSGRMIVFRLRDDEHLDVLEDARAPLRLARELRDDDALGEDAIARTLEALHDFRAIADGAGADRVIAVATSAVRDATDGHMLVEEARRIGILLEVIDGDLEARLGFLGAVHDLPVTAGLTMDVGGGSVELSRFVERKLDASWTLPLGSLRVSDRFLEHDPPSEKELSALRAHVARTLEAAGVTELRRGEDLIGIGGTVRNLAKIDLRRTDQPLPLLHGYELTERHLGDIVPELAERPMKRRGQIPGLNPDRADTVVGGALVVQGVIAHVGARRVIVSSRGLREGLALDAYGREVPPARWVRTISVATLAARFATWDGETARRRASIAVRLHESLEPSAPLSVHEMLEHAAVLVDIGRAIDYYGRFAHAAQIVVAADVAGFAHHDVAALATILRGGADDRREGPYAHLTEGALRTAVDRAAATLALADELNRRIPRGAPAPIACRWLRDGFEVTAPVPARWRPRGVAERFSEAFGRPLLVIPSGSPADA
jgi:exopolyphosphatase / guanosine-5'-triphosphate,3'-diphosphate pyrophosphatase